ncbi:uncharacterized protein CPUR_03569 [Claviceps purpurea 20.1]|uniref:Uncharacterized protein n=1 Tax=Claviceps purpurea (strain 20.1) TaxID=1111077 RepID=M1VVL3_CLAP2|nr:uncharacterized protein CPUR_03569 [Claviceps purpurea 20.1]
MSRSLSVRKRRMAKAPVSPPYCRKSDELSLVAVPYSSTISSDPPAQQMSVKTPMSPSTLCSRSSSPTKPVSAASSIYPDSTQSTVVPSSPHSSILALFPARDPVTTYIATGEKCISIYTPTLDWEDVYDDSETVFVAEPENQLPAYLAPHIIPSTRDEDQPKELFAMPSKMSSSMARSAPVVMPGRLHHPPPWPSEKNSPSATETPSMLTGWKQKQRRFWGTFRLSKKQNGDHPEKESLPSPLEESTGRDRLDSNTDTVTTEESIETPNEVCPWETQDALSGTTIVVEAQDGKGILNAADGVADCQENQKLGHTIVMDIPGDACFGNEFWAKFPRCFI